MLDALTNAARARALAAAARDAADGGVAASTAAAAAARAHPARARCLAALWILCSEPSNVARALVGDGERFVGDAADAAAAAARREATAAALGFVARSAVCLLYTSPSPRD